MVCKGRLSSEKGVIYRPSAFLYDPQIRGRKNRNYQSTSVL